MSNKKLPRTELSFARQQLKAQQGVAARLRKENEKLRQDLAKERLKAPMQDLLLVLVRLCRGNHDLLCELLDKKVEESLDADHAKAVIKDYFNTRPEAISGNDK